MAYFDYIFSIVLGALFITVGFGFFRYGRFARILRIPGTLAMLVGLGVLWISLSSPTPRQRTAALAHIFHTPPQQIIKVTIRAKSLRPLVTRDLTVTDRESLGQIALALSKASEPMNSPVRSGLRTRVWQAPVELTTSDGTFYFRAGVTRGVGGFVVVGTEPDGFGWRLGVFRADELAGVLEQLRDKASIQSNLASMHINTAKSVAPTQ